MVFGFLLTTLIAVIFWASHPKRADSCWAGLVFFTAGVGFVSGPLSEAAQAYLFGRLYHADWYYRLLEFLGSATLFSSVYLFPFCYLMFALHSCERWHPRLIKRAAWLLAMPILFTPFVPLLEQTTIALLWVAPYLLFASFLLVQAYLKESNSERKNVKAVTALFFVPITTIDLFTGYVGDVFALPYMRELNIGLALLAFLLFIFFIIHNGSLGFRLRVERQQINIAMEGLSSGTLKLTHALKNQISKMRVYGFILRKMADESDNSDLHLQSERILDTATHMLSMMERIEFQSHAFVLNEEAVDVQVLLDAVIDSFDLTAQGIQVERAYGLPVMLRCDGVHLKEVMTNLISNAIDAIERPDGKLIISCASHPRAFVISVKDNGAGIPKSDLRKVLQPFYTTKNQDSHHFGMGLSYCYAVMAKHKGELRIDSRIGHGTEVSLYFKRNRVRTREWQHTPYSIRG